MQIYIFFHFAWAYSPIFVTFAYEIEVIMNKWLKRKRNTLGYGVQSPNDFYFVRHVLREQSPYYGYAAIREIQKKYAPHVPCYPESIDRLLFRLANYTQPKTIVEVGAGLSIFAMAEARPSAMCVAVTSSSMCSKAIQPLLSDYPQVEVKNSDEMAFFRDILRSLGTIGLLHIAHTAHYREIVDTALPYTTDRTLIIIEDIRAEKEKQDWWKSMQENSSTGISYDLGSIGLLFFDRSRHKNTYWINLKD